MWKEVVVTYFKVINRRSPRRTKQNRDKKSSRAGGALPEILTKHILNAIPKQACSASCFFPKTFSAEVIFYPRFFLIHL
jgi:hypothetical protein